MSQEEKRPLLRASAADSTTAGDNAGDGYQQQYDGYQSVGNNADSNNVYASMPGVVTGVVEICPRAIDSGGDDQAGGGGGVVDVQDTSANSSDLIPCRVCGEYLDLSDRADRHVVKCVHCNEATPVRSAPPGKKYVRCPCNCLLICRTSSHRIACPRPACRRVISLPTAGANITPGGSSHQTSVQPPPPGVPGMCRITCCYCLDSFLFNTLNNALARCPHCRRISSIGARFARGRAIGFLVVAMLVLVVSVGVTAGTFTYSHTHHGIYIVYVGGFLSSLLLLLRSVYYFTLRVSHSDRSSTDA